MYSHFRTGSKDSMQRASDAIAYKEKISTQLKQACRCCHKPLTRSISKPSIFTQWLAPLTLCQCEPADSNVSAGESTTSQPTILPQLDEHLEVIDLVGQGGMGQVFKVRDKNLDKTFAAKVLRAEYGRSELARNR